MELTYDWHGFQAIFHPYRRKDTRQPESPLSPPPIFVVMDGEIVLAANIGDEDPSPWLGQSLQKLITELPGRELVIFDRREVDSWNQGALALPHFYDQSEYLRETAEPRVISAKGVARQLKKGALSELTQQHFLLEAIHTWWKKVMPSSYGVYIRLEPARNRELTPAQRSQLAPSKEIFVLVRRGRIELFHSPDLSAMGPERQRQPEAVVRYLMEKHLVRVQGLVAIEEEWAEWSDPECGRGAWRKMALAIRARRARLVPFRWQVLGLVASRGILGV